MIGRAPAFWSRSDSLAGRLLSPLGRVIGGITLRRMGRAGAAVGVPVICIGNPTVGGAGKTPTALMVLDHLTASGARPFALLRGHGGRLRGPVRVDPAQHDASAVGDEALLLAGVAPTIVSRDRLAGARRAATDGATHIVMDDGFQNPALLKDVSLLIIDGAAGVGNGRVIPSGPLRAPLVPQLAAADAVLIVGRGAAGDSVAAAASAQDKGVLRGEVVPDPDAIVALRGRKVLAFAGIGRPEKLVTTLVGAGIEVARLREFADHHPYTPGEIAGLVADADAANLTLVTTSKDMARLGSPAFARLVPRITVLPVRMALSDLAALDVLVALATERAAQRRNHVRSG